MAADQPDRCDETLDQLNLLLADELSASASYEAACRIMASPPLLELQENLASHRQRSVLLADAITALGRISEGGVALWGELGTAGASPRHPLDRRRAIDDLLAGENRMLARYHRALTHVDPRHRRLLATELMPAQELTRGRINLLWMSGTPPGPPP